uniref:Uncharacterized protein n=1 Tax=Tanacetum cinerariifolium TaxID=118510 RepID=A0A699H7I3_TANCI|nr:hypothetical protein [Tanacetum cinerariifolium]
MPKSNNEKKNTNAFKRTARIYVCACFLVNPRPASPPYQHLSSPIDYQMAPPTTLIESHPSSPMASSGFYQVHLLNTPKTSPSPLSSPPPAPSQPFKQNSPLAINLELIELIFSTSPTFPHPLFYSLEDLPPRTANPPPPQPTFESIEHLGKQPPPIPEVMEPPLPPLPPQLPPHSQPMWTTNDFPPLTHEIFCEHCQRTQVIVNDLRDEMRFILNHILERLTTLTYQNFP